MEYTDMSEKADKITIDRQYNPADGRLWYHMGNYYWLDQYKEFYQWLDTSKIHSEQDFPHDYWYFPDTNYEIEFLDKWGEYVENVDWLFGDDDAYYAYDEERP